MRNLSVLLVLLLLAGCPARQPAESASATAAPQREIKRAAQQAHPATLTTTTFKVEGMTCEDCSKSIEAELIKQAGVTTVSADHKAGKAIVQYDATKVTPDVLIASIESLKFKAAQVN